MITILSVIYKITLLPYLQNRNQQQSLDREEIFSPSIREKKCTLHFFTRAKMRTYTRINVSLLILVVIFLQSSIICVEGGWFGLNGAKEEDKKETKDNTNIRSSFRDNNSKDKKAEGSGYFSGLIVEQSNTIEDNDAIKQDSVNLDDASLMAGRRTYFSNQNQPTTNEDTKAQQQYNNLGYQVNNDQNRNNQQVEEVPATGFQRGSWRFPTWSSENQNQEDESKEQGPPVIDPVLLGTMTPDGETSEELDMDSLMFKTDLAYGGIYPMPNRDVGMPQTMYSNGGDAVNRAETSFGFDNSGYDSNTGNQVRSDPGYSRVAFVGYKRISAINTDFNLPISRFDKFGSAIANMGDLDGDPNTVEVAVGAPGDHTYTEGAGAVYILSLNSYSSIINYRKLIPGEGCLTEENMYRSGFGTAVASIGDLNGDGIEDLAVGAPFKDLTGAVYILYMNRGGYVKGYSKINNVFGNFHADLVLGDEFGCSIANVGDLDYDGVPDLVVGACGDDDTPPYEAPILGGAGAVYVLFMRRDGTVRDHRKISARYGNLIVGPTDGDRFGASVAYLGDLDRDGSPDIAVGAPKADSNGKCPIQVGQVWQLELLPSGDVKRFQIVSSRYVPLDPHYNSYVYFSAKLSCLDFFGSAVGSMDIDRDGLYDLVVGARGRDSNLVHDSGAAYVIYLDWNGNLWAWDEINSQAGLNLMLQPGENFGSAFTFINGHFVTLLVGAPGEALGTQGGSVYCLTAEPF